MIKFWKKRHPRQYRSYIMDVKDKRDTRGNEFGGAKGSRQRYLVDIPVDVWNMITVMYGDKEIIDIYDSKFFRQFAKRFPEFAVAEKI